MADRETLEAIEQLAQERGISFGEFIRRVVDAYIKRLREWHALRVCSTLLLGEYLHIYSSFVEIPGNSFFTQSGQQP
ncbi:MAG: ribbon-helix-helix domain-containing protein [Planctomycetota bacterium]